MLPDEIPHGRADWRRVPAAGDAQRLEFANWSREKFPDRRVERRILAKRQTGTESGIVLELNLASWRLLPFEIGVEKIEKIAADLCREAGYCRSNRLILKGCLEFFVHVFCGL